MDVMSILQWEDQIGVRNAWDSAHKYGTLSCHLHSEQTVEKYQFFFYWWDCSFEKFHDNVKMGSVAH